jgi:hypothetical protein
MLYAMAQISDPHDESAVYGQAVNPDVGASSRSAMKGWNQNGVCQANYFAQSGACKPAAQYAVPELALHVISIGDNGILRTNGQWAKTVKSRIFSQLNFPHKPPLGPRSV